MYYEGQKLPNSKFYKNESVYTIFFLHLIFSFGILKVLSVISLFLLSVSSLFPFFFRVVVL